MKHGDITRQDQSDFLPNAIVGSFTRDMSLASGTQAVVGVGFKPSHIIFFANQEDQVELSWGLDDGILHKAVRKQNTNFGIATNQSISAIEPAGNYQGFIDTGGLNSDGFTITWARVSAITGTLTIFYMAFK